MIIRISEGHQNHDEAALQSPFPGFSINRGGSCILAFGISRALMAQSKDSI
jgi:hypothetical protein